MKTCNYIFVTDGTKEITRLSRDVKALTICCGVLFMMCVKNHLDICERDTIIEKLRAERNDGNA